MSEMINKSNERKAKLKKLILKLHSGESQEQVRKELIESLRQVPYEEVIQVEQELIDEGLSESEVLKLCDAHSAVLDGNVDLRGMRKFPDGHPVDVMLKENSELKKVTEQINLVLQAVEKNKDTNLPEDILRLHALFNSLFDVDKHYQRKEYLLFPFLEKEGITGPPKVMWGKHDEVRDLIKGSIELLGTRDMSRDDLLASSGIFFKPAIKGVEEMTVKEEQILLPMSLDNLSESDWQQIHNQSLEIGFCLYDPPVEWEPVSGPDEASAGTLQQSGSRIQLPSGGFSAEELLSILNTLPVDITFVDKDDRVRYFSQGAVRVFQRNRAILNRDVRHCHPPASAHIVDRIIEDFKSGKQSRAPFWIKLEEKLIFIEYFALRNEKGEYLGTLEVSQDLTEHRELQGEQRILSYSQGR